MEIYGETLFNQSQAPSQVFLSQVQINPDYKGSKKQLQEIKARDYQFNQGINPISRHQFPSICPVGFHIDL